MKPPRTLLLAPAHDPASVARALSSKADAVILDLEDLVPTEAKDSARQAVLQAAGASRRPDLALGVRVNGPSSPRFLDDGRALTAARLDFTLIPHVTGLVEAQFAAKYYGILGRLDDGEHRLLMTVETPGCLIDLPTIVRADIPIGGLIVGANDYLVETGGEASARTNTPRMAPAGLDALAHLRGVVLAAARARGLIAIDTVPQSDLSPADWTDQIRRSRLIGFDGCTVRTAEQVAAGNEIFSRTEGDS